MKTWHILVSIVLVAIIGFGIIPLWQDVRIAKAENGKLIEDIEELNKQLNRVETIKKGQSNNQKLLKRFPLDNEQENVIRDIRSIALKSGFGFKDLRFSRGVNSVVKLPELKISFSTEGNKKGLKNFLSLIESNERFLGMEKLDVYTNETGGTSTVRFAVSLYSFFQK